MIFCINFQRIQFEYFILHFIKLAVYRARVLGVIFDQIKVSVLYNLNKTADQFIFRRDHSLRDRIGSSSIAYVRASDLLSVIYIIRILHA